MESLEQIVLKAVAAVTGNDLEDVNLSTQIFSMTKENRMELGDLLEDELDTVLDRDAIAEAETVGDVLKVAADA